MVHMAAFFLKHMHMQNEASRAGCPIPVHPHFTDFTRVSEWDSNQPKFQKFPLKTLMNDRTTLWIHTWKSVHAYLVCKLYPMYSYLVITSLDLTLQQTSLEWHCKS